MHPSTEALITLTYNQCSDIPVKLCGSLFVMFL